MRKFFYQLLQNLDKITGMKQYEKLMQMENYKEEIKTLLDILCRVTDQFPYIPDEDKKRIINDAVIADQEFIGLNAKIIYKWLNIRKEQYFKELAHKEVENSEPPLTGEAMQKRLDEWLKAVNEAEVNFTKEIPFKTVREQWKPKEGTPIYEPSIDNVLLFEKERHFEWIKANFDARTGKPLPEWVSENEWNKQYDETNNNPR